MYSIANDAIKTFTTIFLNLYLWSNGESLVTIATFNISMYITWSIIFPISASLVNKKGVKFFYRMSAIANIMMFFSILAIPKENFGLWVMLVGLTAGFSRGIYSSARNIAISVMAEEKNEIINFYRYEVLILRIGQIITPLILGVLIQYTSYTESFIFMLVYCR